MAVYTRIESAELDAFLASYGLAPADRYGGIAGGIENTNYRVFSGGRRLILTLYEGRTDVAELPYFLGLMDHVARAGASAAAPLSRLDGGTLGTLAGRPAALVVHLEGADVAEPGPAEARAAGVALAEFHRAASDYPATRPNALGPSAWRAAADRLGEALDRVEPDAARRATARTATLDARWPEGLPTGTIHADLFPDNVLFENGAVSGIIDLYFACTDALAYDLAVAMASWTPERREGMPDPANALAMREGYESVRPLTEAEAAALPLLLEGACWRFFLTRAEDWLSPRASVAGRVKDPLPFCHLARQIEADPSHLTESE